MWQNCDGLYQLSTYWAIVKVDRRNIYVAEEISVERNRVGPGVWGVSNYVEGYYGNDDSTKIEPSRMIMCSVKISDQTEYYYLICSRSFV